MKLSIAAHALCASAANGFTFNKAAKTSTIALRDTLNGWVPDESKFAYGLPGSLAPAGEFDPLGFATDADLDTVKRYREAEVQHGRVAMLAVLGFLVTGTFLRCFVDLHSSMLVGVVGIDDDVSPFTYSHTPVCHSIRGSI